MVVLLLNFIEAAISNASKPYDCIFDHNKYFQRGLVYLTDMLRLPHFAPEVHLTFLDGKHVVSRSKEKSHFNSVSTDMALEQSLNHESKVKGGVIGITHDDKALEKWTITAHLRSAVVENIKTMSDSCKNVNKQKDLFTSNIIKSEERVKCVLEAADKVSDPFEFVEWLGRNKTRPLVNIVNGSVMDQDSADQLLNAFNKGKDLLEEFVKYKMIENPQ